MVKNSVRKDKRAWTDGLAQKAQIAVRQQKSRELYRVIKQRSKQISTLIRPKEERLLTTSDEQTERWRIYFEDILNSTTNEQEQNEVENENRQY